MTLLGKVFIGLICLLSIIFFSLSVAVNATHIDYRDQLKNPTSGFEKRLKDAETKNQQLTKQIEDYKNELAIEQTARRQVLAALQTQIEDRDTRLKAQDEELKKVLAAQSELSQSELATTKELVAKTAENDSLRAKINETREDRNQLYTRLVGTIDDYNRLQGMLQSLKERSDQLASDYTSAKEKLDYHNISPRELIGPPSVNGEVLAVSTSGLVEVSLGRDDGLREGFTLEARRGSQYLGRLKVKTVAKDKAVAEILPGYQKGYIREGDRVDSKLF